MKWVLLVRSAIENRLPLVKRLLLIELTGLALILFRQFLPVDKPFVFLIWNLFLAFIPLALSSILLQMQRKKFSLYSQLSIGLLWLLFFPNAPYMLTDYIHLTYGDPSYLWLDAITLSFFALTAFVVAIISFRDIGHFLGAFFKGRQVTLVVFLLSALVGVGIFLGRDLRYNSWDAILKPKELLHESVSRISDPSGDIYTWTNALFISILLFGAYMIWPKHWEKYMKN